MKYFISILLIGLLSHTSLFAQYYYNDIIATENTNQYQKLLKQNKIRSIKIINKDIDGSVVEDFLVEQMINADASVITTSSQTSKGNKSVLKSFFTNNTIAKTTNEGDGVSNTTFYTYDEKGKIQYIESFTKDTFITTQSNELHEWQYNNNGIPERLLKIKNKKDTTVVSFVVDENNLVVEEHWKRNGKEIEVYYYYYNNKNKLTDIVRYNQSAKKMLPDFMYEYDANGNIKKMIQVIAGGTNYNTWYYTYNTNGLKEKEVCYDKKKQLLGSLEYLYNN